MEPGQIPNDPNAQNAPATPPSPTPTPGQSFQPTSYQSGESEQPYNAPQQPIQPMQVTPMPQQPIGQYIQSPAPGTVQDPAATMPGIVMAGSKKSSKGPLIALLIVFILALVVGGAFYLFDKKKPQTQNNSSTSTNGVTHSYATSENTALASLKSGGASLTSADLGAINKTDLFYAVFRNASEQQTVTTTYNSYWTPQLNGAPIVSSSSHMAFVTQGGYDYKNNQFSFQANLDGSVEKCVNGVEYLAYTDDTSLPWAKDESGNSDCQLSSTTDILNDGLNTGGLSTAQGQNFVDAIRDISGLINVTNASLVTQQGKPYVRIDATVNAKTDCYAGSVPSGVGCFGVAFNYLKLPKSWPDQTDATVVSGATLSYFVDPTTQLPAYMQIAYTPVSATQGNWQNQQIEYSFAPLSTFQLTNGNLNPPTVTWPVAQLSQ